MKLIEKILLALAASRYAKRLGPRLARDYGGGGNYTIGQIRTAVKKCWLPKRYIKLAYAAFMEEDAFRAAADARDWPAYAELRALYFDHVPRRSFAQVNAPEYDTTLTY